VSQPIDDMSPEDPNPSPGEPDLAYNVYKSVGLDGSTVALQGSRAPIATLKPGDLVGWNGGSQPDGKYIGNVAVYAGDGEIIETAFGRTRRRKIHYTENVFGMPVNMMGDEEETTMPEQPPQAEDMAVD